MTTNLSKQLCKLCGIEPLYMIKTAELYQGITTSCRYFTSPDEAKRYTGNSAQQIKEVYPNFFEPENFVKLLEIKVKFFALIFTEPKDIKKSLIKVCISDAKKCERFAKAIKDEEWDYG